MEVLVDDVIGNARMFAQDDMNDNKGAILKPERWLTQCNSVYKALYKRWLRQGLVVAPPLDQEFSGPDTRLGGVSSQPIGPTKEITPGVVAIQGVAYGTIAGFRGASVDLSRWLDGMPRVVFSFRETAARPTLELRGDATGNATFTRSGSAFTLAIEPGVSTAGSLVAALDASPDIELLFISPTYDSSLVLDDPLLSLNTPYSVKGGEVLMTDLVQIRSAQSTERYRATMEWNHNSPAFKWAAYSEMSTVRVSVIPRDTSLQYVVRYYEMPPTITSRSQYITVPDNADQYMAMKLAEVAMMTEGGSSKKLDEFIRNAEAELAFTSAALLKPTLKAPKANHGWCLNPQLWRWF